MAGYVKELNSDSFDDFLDGDNVIVDFWAPWCGPCRILAPEVEKASEELRDRVKFGKVNVDENSDLAQRFGIMSIPTMVLFSNKKQVDFLSGSMRSDEIVNRAKKVFSNK